MIATSSALPYEGGYYAWCAGYGKFLGISRGMALLVASIFDIGDLPHAVRGLPDPDVPVVPGKQPRMVGLRWR